MITFYSGLDTPFCRNEEVHRTLRLLSLILESLEVNEHTVCVCSVCTPSLLSSPERVDSLPSTEASVSFLSHLASPHSSNSHIYPPHLCTAYCSSTPQSALYLSPRSTRSTETFVCVDVDSFHCLFHYSSSSSCHYHFLTSWIEFSYFHSFCLYDYWTLLDSRESDCIG